MKSQTKQLKDAAVDAILEEAAEAFAIEKAAQDNYDVPTFEDVAREVRSRSSLVMYYITYG